MADSGDLTGPLMRAFGDAESAVEAMEPDDAWAAAEQVSEWVQRWARPRAARLRGRAAMRIREAGKYDLAALGSHLNMSTTRAWQLAQLAKTDPDGDAAGEEE